MIFCEYALPIPGSSSNCSFVAELMSRSSAAFDGMAGACTCVVCKRSVLAEAPDFPAQLARTNTRQIAALQAARIRFAFMNDALLFHLNLAGRLACTAEPSPMQLRKICSHG